MIARALSRLFEPRYATPSNDAISRWIWWTGNGASDAGPNVNSNTILRNSSVWRGVALISGDISVLPIHLYRRTNGGKERATDHPNYSVFRWKPGAITADIWKRRVISQVLLWGNSYSLINRSSNGKVFLTLLHPDNVKVEPAKIGDGSLVYIVGHAPNEKRYSSADIVHVQGLTHDVFGGLSIIEYARNTIGRHLAAEGYSDDFFKHGVVRAGWFKLPPGATMSLEAQDRFLSQYKSSTKHTAGILEDGMEWEPAGVSPKDAMLIDMLHLTPYDVARYLNCPPHKLGTEGSQTQSNTGEENGDYWRSTIPPLLTAIEMELWDKCLREKEKHDEPGGLYYEFLMDSILRASTLERYQIYRLATSSRILNPNECRALENRNPYDGGDEYLNPYTTKDGGISTVDGGRNPTEIDEPDTPGGRSSDLSQHVAGVVREAFLRCAKRLTIAGEQAAKHPTKYLDFLDRVREQHAATVREWLRPAITLSSALEGESEPVDRLNACVDALFEAFDSHYLAASDVQPTELATAVRNASHRLLADAGAIASDLISEKIERKTDENP